MCSGGPPKPPAHSYMKEYTDSTSAINRIVSGTTPTSANIAPLDTWRDDIIGHIENDYNDITGTAILAQDESLSVKALKAQLANTTAAGTELDEKIKKTTAYSEKQKKEYKFQVEKQKAIVDLLIVFCATIGVYVILGANENVHIIALLVLLGGIMFVVFYHAYRIKLPGSSLLSVVSGVMFDADFSKTLLDAKSSKMPDSNSSLKPPVTPAHPK